MYLPTSHWSSSSDYDDQIDSDSSVFVSKGKICCGEGSILIKDISFWYYEKTA